MLSANAHTSKKFTRMCFEKSEVTSAGKEKKIKMVVSKLLTHLREQTSRQVDKLTS